MELRKSIPPEEFIPDEEDRLALGHYYHSIIPIVIKWGTIHEIFNWLINEHSAQIDLSFNKEIKNTCITIDIPERNFMSEGQDEDASNNIEIAWNCIMKFINYLSFPDPDRYDY